MAPLCHNEGQLVDASVPVCEIFFGLF